jgi:hypothetical protein
MSILTRVAFKIKGPQFGSGFVAVNPNSKIPVGLKLQSCLILVAIGFSLLNVALWQMYASECGLKQLCDFETQRHTFP